MPISRKRRVLTTTRRALTVLLADFLAAQSPDLTRQLFRYGIPTGPSAHLLAGVDHLIIDWRALIPRITPLLTTVVQNGATQAIAQIKRYRARKARADEITQLANDRAEAWAESRAAEMVGMKVLSGHLMPNPNAKWRIDESTRESLRSLVTEAIDEGWSNDTLASAIETSEAFSHDRAERIARTETAKADIQGNLIGYRAVGVEKKESILGDLHEIPDECDDNADEGAIEIDAAFSSGDDGPPYHPGCICDVLPVLSEEPELTDEESLVQS